MKKKHWADKALEELKKNGYITTDKNPDSPVSWGEFATVINRLRKNINEKIDKE